MFLLVFNLILIGGPLCTVCSVDGGVCVWSSSECDSLYSRHSLPQLIEIVGRINVASTTCVHEFSRFFWRLCRTFGKTFTNTKVGQSGIWGGVVVVVDPIFSALCDLLLGFGRCDASLRCWFELSRTFYSLSLIPKVKPQFQEILRLSEENVGKQEFTSPRITPFLSAGERTHTTLLYRVKLVFLHSIVSEVFLPVFQRSAF